jgi:hypothetical protein
MSAFRPFTVAFVRPEPHRGASQHSRGARGQPGRRHRNAIAEGAEFEAEIRLPAPVRVAVRRFVKPRAEEAALLVQKANLARVVAEAYSPRRELACAGRSARVSWAIWAARR